MLNFLFYSIIFIFGLAIGSLLNCIIYRLHTGESFLKGRSFCPHCRHQLGWQDLIPILSFIILAGRCRYCKKSISLQYPLVEFSTAILFLLTPYLGDRLNLTELFFNWVFISFLIIIFVYDLKHYIIPDQVIYPAIAIVLLYQMFRIWPPTRFWWGVGFGILPSFFFLAIFVLSKGQWMGFGDFKLALFMGLFLGWPNILIALFLAFLIGAIIGMGLIIAGKKTLKSEIPFGPFLVAGTFIALFWGEKLINWYFNNLLMI